jgi:hypothetical protein
VARFVGFLLFLVFADDWGSAYSSRLGQPLGWVHDILLVPTPISVRPLDLILLVVLGIAMSRNRRGTLVAPMRNAALLVLAATLLCFVYGLFHGGDFRHASWQTYLIMSTILVAFTVAMTFRTTADFEALAKWMVIAALYHAFMCWLSYFTWAQKLVGESGAYMTTHDDTIPWVVAILILTVNALTRRSPAVTARNSVLIFFLLGAIQWNSRRLAWVSLVMGLIVLYSLFPPGVAKRRINRYGKFVMPIVLLYTVVGWGRESKIFLPLRALSSVSTREDASTLARNAENLGLIATANSGGLFGTGWGNPYICLTMKYDISGFELWRYVPHNSILGLLAFTGIIGFAGFWLAIPTAVFLNARVARLVSDPRARSVALIGAAQMIVSINQLYGDMGIFFPKPMYVIAVSYAIAMRLPRIVGVWDPAAAPRMRAA